MLGTPVTLGSTTDCRLRLAALKVLVVDESASTRNLIAEVLRSLGVNQVFKADDARTGRMMLQEGGFDLVFAEIEMAQESGLEFVRWVRASPDPRIAGAVVVMISAHATESQVIEAGAAGANSVLVKPFSVAAFERRLAEAFAHRRTMTQPRRRKTVFV